MGQRKSRGDRERGRGKAAQARDKKRAAKKKKDSTTKRGTAFERRAARAIEQIKPGLVVSHNKRLVTEPGHRRQFDVVGHLDGILSHTYEARDHERKVDLYQIEAFQTKNATLIEKPRVAGIISAKGFWESPIEWIRHYGDQMLVQELYHLRSSVPEDWGGDIRQMKFEAIGKCAKVLPVRILYGDSLPENAGRDVTLTSGRMHSFVKDAKGRVVANLLDVVNHEVRLASSTGALGRRTVSLPEGSYLTVGECTRNVVGLEIEFEEISIPSTALIDHSGRFPDTLIDVLTGEQWLINDPERALKASRTGYDLTIEFTDPDDNVPFNIEDLPPVPEHEEAGVPRNLGARMAAVVLHAALAMARGGARHEEIPAELTELLHKASAAMDAHDYVEAERLYKESLSLGTALAALCGLGYLVSERGDHAAAVFYSLAAARTFPLEAHGFANLVASLLASGDLTNARLVLDRARVLHGVSFQMRRQEADLLYREGKFAEAADLFYELTLDDEDDPKLLANLARCEHALGRYDAAAWDARRAALKAPTHTTIAGLAATYAEDAGDLAGVIDVVQRLYERGGEVLLPFARLAVNAFLKLRNIEQAKNWLTRVPRVQWMAVDYSIYGQMRAHGEGAAAGLEELRHALGAQDLSDDIKVMFADYALRADAPKELLAVLTDHSDPRIKRLRAFAHAMLADAQSAIREVTGLPDAVANRIIKECMGWCPSKLDGDLRPLSALADWLMARESSDPDIMKRQAWLLASNACGQRNAEGAEKALGLISQCRLLGVADAELTLAEILAHVGRRDIGNAQTLVKALNPSEHSADVIAGMTNVIFAAAVPSLSFQLAEIFYSCGIPANHFPTALLNTLYVLSAFASGAELEIVQRISSNKTFVNDARGVMVRALIDYAERRYAECLEALGPLVLAPPGPREAIVLQAQCLAEQGAFSKLSPLAQRFWKDYMPMIEWAAKREAGPLPDEDLVLVAATFVNHPPEFSAVSMIRNIVQTYPGSYWADALKRAFSGAPESEKVWLARLEYPKRFIQSLLLPPLGAAEA